MFFRPTAVTADNERRSDNLEFWVRDHELADKRGKVVSNLVDVGGQRWSRFDVTVAGSNRVVNKQNVRLVHLQDGPKSKPLAESSLNLTEQPLIFHQIWMQKALEHLKLY